MNEFVLYGWKTILKRIIDQPVISGITVTIMLLIGPKLSHTANPSMKIEYCIYIFSEWMSSFTTEMGDHSRVYRVGA